MSAGDQLPPDAQAGVYTPDASGALVFAGVYPSPQAEHVLLDVHLGSSNATPASITVADDGGQALTLVGDWLPGIDHAVTINGVLCYSGSMGRGYAPRPAGRALTAIVPADLPVGGPYDVEVAWKAPGGDVESLTFEDVVTVVRRPRRSATAQLARMWPLGPFRRGDADLRAGRILEAGVNAPVAVGVLPAVISAVGQILNDVGGHLATRLRSPVTPALLGTTPAGSALSAEVESTFGAPAAGALSINGEAITYTGADGDTFTGLGRDDAQTETHGRGDVAVFTGSPRSAVDLARAALIVDSAAGGFLDTIGQNYGVPRINEADDTLYRKLIRTLAYQPGRGTAGAIGALLDLLLGATAPGGGDGQTSDTNLLTVDSEPFTPEMVGLDVEVAGSRYRIAGYTSASVVSLSLRPGPWAIPAFSEAATGVAWRIIPWQVVTDPWDPAVAQITVCYPSPESPLGLAYLQGGELATSTTTTKVTVDHQIRQVLGVWLATDPYRQGTNYATTNNFLAKAVLLDTALPGANTEVIVDYGSVIDTDATDGEDGEALGPATAQILESANVRNPGDEDEAANYPLVVAPIVRYPLYIGSMVGDLLSTLSTLTVAGVRPRLDVRLY